MCHLRGTWYSLLQTPLSAKEISKKSSKMLSNISFHRKLACTSHSQLYTEDEASPTPSDKTFLFPVGGLINCSLGSMSELIHRFDIATLHSSRKTIFGLPPSRIQDGSLPILSNQDPPSTNICCLEQRQRQSTVYRLPSYTRLSESSLAVQDMSSKSRFCYKLSSSAWQSRLASPNTSSPDNPAPAVTRHNVSISPSSIENDDLNTYRSLRRQYQCMLRIRKNMRHNATKEIRRPNDVWKNIRLRKSIHKRRPLQLNRLQHS